MSDYFGEESPWAQPSADTGLNTFEVPLVDDGASPWGNPADDRDSDSDSAKVGLLEPHSDVNPYDDTPYGDSLAPIVSEADPEAQEPSEQRAELAAAPEKVPDLKPMQRKIKTNKKKRAGEVKSESVASDPLATSTIQFDNVALASDSVANLKLSSTANYPETARSAEQQAPESGDYSQAWQTPQPLSEASSSIQKQVSSPKNTSFAISVGDPLMVGEMTNVHTEYTIQMTTTSELYDVKEATVQRRYRDFRWLYRTLEHNHPGVVVPPPPEKQALGRFNDDFVQQRRAALEQMLRKITAHPLLYEDGDLKAFLTSADFADYLQTRMNADSDLEQATRSALNKSEQGVGSWDSDSGSGFLGTLSGALSLSRGVELDPWTLEKRSHLDKVESQLKEVCKELVSISLHRQQLSDALGDFANVTRAMGEIEATRRLSGVLRSFAKVHDRLAQIYVRQRQQNLLTLESTLDEHLRTVGSVRDALGARQRVFSAAENASSEVEKRQLALDKLMRQSRNQEDRVKALEDEIEQLTQTASQLHKRAADIARLVEREIARVNEEKIEDFRNSVEIFLENTVETQKETIEIWETFYTQNFASS